MNYKIKILILLNSILLLSCTDCDKLALNYKERECILKIHTNSLDINSFYVGKNPYTNEICDCRNDFHSYLRYDKYLEIGDTLVKKKGDLYLTIHKKDTVLTFNFVCEGKRYN